MHHVVHQQGLRRLERCSGRLPKPIPGYSSIPALAAVRNMKTLSGFGLGFPAHQRVHTDPVNNRKTEPQ